MFCFYHTERPAHGICKHCSKGLCPECLADLGIGLACKNHCEQEVRDLYDLFTRGKTVYQKGSSSYYRVAIWMGLMGLMFLGFALGFNIESPMKLYFYGAGGLFLMGGLFSLISAQNLRKK